MKKGFLYCQLILIIYQILHWQISDQSNSFFTVNRKRQINPSFPLNLQSSSVNDHFCTDDNFL